MVALFFIVPSICSHSSLGFAKPPLRVAVIDTGVDIQHGFLSNLIWANPGESGLDTNGNSRASNGVDDDGNGYVDDIHGWNFADNNSKLSDETGHGTHVTGIIKSITYENDVNSRVEFVILKYYRPRMRGKDQRTAFIKALEYAVQMKVDIINISGGGAIFNEQERRLLERANEQGIFVVAAAGNKKIKSDHFNFYPAAYKLPNILSVVAVDKTGRILPTSNLNPDRDNVLALGRAVRSSIPGNKFALKTGSSQAAAIVTGRIVQQMLSNGRHIPLRISNYVAESSKNLLVE